jgi:hypothetical protein
VVSNRTLSEETAGEVDLELPRLRTCQLQENMSFGITESLNLLDAGQSPPIMDLIAFIGLLKKGDAYDFFKNAPL